MPLISFPDVPISPGVPSVLRDPAFVASPGVFSAIGVGAITGLLFGAGRWGIYSDAGAPVILADSFIGIRFRNATRISSFPVEAGSFSSFNKVDTPYDAVVRFAFSGDQTSRGALLTLLEAIKSDVNLYSVVTPDHSYSSANIVAYSYERGPQTGPSHLLVDVYVEEVREQAVAQFNETQEPSGAQAQSNGQVQTFPIGAEPGAPLILETEFQ